MLDYEENDNDEIDDEEEMSEEEADFLNWYDCYSTYFKFEDKAPYVPPIEVEMYYYNVYQPVMKELCPIVRKLVNMHYPLIGNEKRPEILQRIDNNAPNIGITFLLGLYGLLLYFRNGANLHEVYSNFDIMLARRQDSNYIRKDIFNGIEGLTLKQKEQLYRLILEKFTNEYNYKDQRFYEFVDVVHPVIFKYCPQIQDFSDDAWVIYSYLLRLEHVEFRLVFEFYHSFIDCELPIEDLSLNGVEIHDKVQHIYSERWENKEKQ